MKSWYKRIWNKLPKPVRWVFNRLDDPWDNLKHKIHGAKIFGYRINISFLMANRETTWPIFKKED